VTALSGAFGSSAATLLSTGPNPACADCYNSNTFASTTAAPYFGPYGQLNEQDLGFTADGFDCEIVGTPNYNDACPCADNLYAQTNNKDTFPLSNESLTATTPAPIPGSGPLSYLMFGFGGLFINRKRLWPAARTAAGKFGIANLANLRLPDLL
jgi:hypothetical protein